VDKLDGSAEAKERLRVVLATLAGHLRVSDACVRLGVKPSRFDQLRIEYLKAALQAAERRRAGRPPQHDATDANEVAGLRRRVAQLEAELRVALVRVEVAAALPRTVAGAQKKHPTTTSRRAPRSKPCS
jgi:anti-sigma-K factor RskA